MPRVTKYIPTEVEFDLPEGASRPDLSISPDSISSFEFLIRDGEPEACRYLCPCGCGNQVFLYLVNSRRRRKNEGHGVAFQGHVWDVREGGHLIHPSVNHLDGCKSHYFINADGAVVWC